MEHNTKYIASNNAYNDIYCQENINVPFSWEYKPGLSKVTHQLSNNDTIRRSNLVLQPPPYRTSKLRVEDTESPFICSVHPSSLRISSFRMENAKEEDPFIEAYKKCTKSPSTLVKRPRKSQRDNGYWPSVMKYMHILFCKYAGDVVSMV